MFRYVDIGMCGPGQEFGHCVVGCPIAVHGFRVFDGKSPQDQSFGFQSFWSAVIHMFLTPFLGNEQIPTKKWVIVMPIGLPYSISEVWSLCKHKLRGYEVIYMKKEALLLIDIQDIYFMPGPMRLHKPHQAAQKAALLLEQFRREGKTVIHVKHRFQLFPDLNKSVKPIEKEKVVCKEYPSSFLKTELQEYLQENGIEKIIVAGMMSHMCVDTTVRACQDYGYEVIVIEDACATKDLRFRGKKLDAETVHAVFMASLDGMFAKVMTLEEYV